MAKSWFQYLSGKKSSREHNRNQRRRDGAPPAPIESLERRVMLAVTASLAGGTLNVIGDDLDNAIVVSRTPGGTILVNNGAIPIVGGPSTIANTNGLNIVGAGGNDTISLNEANGPLPGASISGGAGNDTLTGGSGEDLFTWNPGDGSDVINGGGGKDSAVFNGSDLPDTFDLRASGSRLQITPTTGGPTLLSGIQNVVVNPLGGADIVTINDLTGAAPNNLQVNLATTPAGSAGDRQPDTVILNATNAADVIPISGGFDFSNTGVITVDNGPLTGGTLPYSLNINATEGDLDTLEVNTLGGNDTVNASGVLATNAAQPIRLSIAGGPGNDTLTGSPRADTFVWNPGDGNDSIDGADGADTVIFNGSDLAEKFNLAANGSLARFTRDLDGAATDFANVEQIDLNPLGGADIITVNDLSLTPVTGINLNLAGIDGATPDAQVDSVVVNGTDAADSLQVTGRSGVLLVDGQFAGISRYFTAIRGLDPNDALRINGNGGSDTIGVDSTFPVNLSIDGGAQHDTLNVTATASNSAPAILPSTGDDDVNVSTPQGNGAAVRFDATQRIGALTVGNNGLATLTAGGQGVLTLTSLSIAATGKLNVNDNALIVDYAAGAASPIGTVQSLVRGGFHSGTWNGNGILTNLGNATRFGLGFAEASVVAPGGTFAGQPVDRTAVVLKFTLFGDGNLDGVVNIGDVNLISQHFNQSPSRWEFGDYNYDDVVNIGDVNLVSRNFNQVLPAGGPAVTGVTQEVSPTDFGVLTTDFSEPQATSNGGDFNYDNAVNVLDLNRLLPNFNTRLDARLPPAIAAILTTSPDSVSSESSPPVVDNTVPLVTGAKAAGATSPTSSSTAAGLSDSSGQVDVVKQRQQLRSKTE